MDPSVKPELQLTPKERQLILLFRTMSDEQKNSIINIAEEEHRVFIENSRQQNDKER